MSQQLLVKILSSIPGGVFNLVYLGRRVRGDGIILNTKAQFLCRVVEKQTVPIEQETVENAREQIENLSALLAGDPVHMADVQDFSIPGPAGDIPVRLYRPASAPSPSPVLVGYHGGGFIRGSIASHDGLFRRLAAYGGFCVLSVDYRLAPEHRYPAAVDDAYAALRWVQEHGAERGLDPDRVAVGGDSSGGNLAAVACQDAKRHGTPQPLCQLLMYPTTDANFTAESHDRFANGFFLTKDRMHWYRDNYLSAPAEINEVRASPGLETDLAGLAPALVITAGFDPLRDEAESYARALKEAGVPMGILRFEGMVHGFMSLTGLFPEAEKALKTAAETLKNRLFTE
ncbi:alpha/beta hydrolase [Sneathiella chinensis]|uniref:Alpha/beta hydrolase n=1 Tax=Sneathiella chinensis TaxID=349750 RepID=A0ABQ5U5B2_9PROT|nr:alpha/beta hydrolase [Sneathiella chinensis]GLQ07312.1 alpha/beta hydrolase [Sneathiella chinensis]